MRQHKLWLCTLLVLLLAALGAFGAAAETTVGMSGAGSFKMEQVYGNVPELDVYFSALDGDGTSYSPIKVQAAGPELTLGDRRLEVRSVAAASDPICYILALDNSKSIEPSEFYTMLGGVRKLINAMGDDDQLMLYTTAGSTECVLPATSDKNLMYKTLGSIKQVEGSMDTARLISAVYSELQSDPPQCGHDRDRCRAGADEYGSVCNAGQRRERPDRYGGVHLPDDRQAGCV